MCEEKPLDMMTEAELAEEAERASEMMNGLYDLHTADGDSQGEAWLRYYESILADQKRRKASE